MIVFVPTTDKDKVKTLFSRRAYNVPLYAYKISKDMVQGYVVVDDQTATLMVHGASKHDFTF